MFFLNFDVLIFVVLTLSRRYLLRQLLTGVLLALVRTAEVLLPEFLSAQVLPRLK
jgi:hypothetical protein